MMEPISQAVIGVMGGHLASNKVSKLNKSRFKWVSLWAALGGMAPDLDYVIRSSTDPLFTIEYHRQFTHSLIFIPFGALIVSALLKIFKAPIKDSYPYVLLGYATHGLLDAFTNYGTQLFWPFAKTRVAWNCVAVVDPLLTIPLIILLVIALKKSNRKFLMIGWIYLFSYLGVGHYQQSKVEKYSKQKNIINEQTTKYMIKPTIANNFIWRVITDQGSYFTFNAIRAPLFGEVKFYQGTSAKKVFEEDILRMVPKDSTQFKDYERFKYFTDDYLIWVDGLRISDARYSLVANDSKPLWSIKFNPQNPNEHIEYEVTRKPSQEAKRRLINMWKGLD